MRTMVCGFEVNRLDSKDAHIWWNTKDRQIIVVKVGTGWVPEGHTWGDDGACWSKWANATEKERIQYLLEFAIDLHSSWGIPMDAIIREFAKIKQFYALGRKSQMMCRVLTKALIGKTLEMVSMDFDELIEAYES